jgi:hypothetical protein
MRSILIRRDPRFRERESHRGQLDTRLEDASLGTSPPAFARDRDGARGAAVSS